MSAQIAFSDPLNTTNSSELSSRRGAIASMIERFRSQPPKSRDERQRSIDSERLKGQFWWLNKDRPAPVTDTISPAATTQRTPGRSTLSGIAAESQLSATITSTTSMLPTPDFSVSINSEVGEKLISTKTTKHYVFGSLEDDEFRRSIDSLDKRAAEALELSEALMRSAKDNNSSRRLQEADRISKLLRKSEEFLSDIDHGTTVSLSDTQVFSARKSRLPTEVLGPSFGSEGSLGSGDGVSVSDSLDAALAASTRQYSPLRTRTPTNPTSSSKKPSFSSSPITVDSTVPSRVTVSGHTSPVQVSITKGTVKIERAVSPIPMRSLSPEQYSIALARVSSRNKTGAHPAAKRSIVIDTNTSISLERKRKESPMQMLSPEGKDGGDSNTAIVAVAEEEYGSEDMMRVSIATSDMTISTQSFPYSSSMDTVPTSVDTAGVSVATDETTKRVEATVPAVEETQHQKQPRQTEVNVVMRTPTTPATATVRPSVRSPQTPPSPLKSERLAINGLIGQVVTERLFEFRTSSQSIIGEYVVHHKPQPRVVSSVATSTTRLSSRGVSTATEIESDRKTSVGMKSATPKSALKTTSAVAAVTQEFSAEKPSGSEASAEVNTLSRSRSNSQDSARSSSSKLILLPKKDIADDSAVEQPRRRRRSSESSMGSDNEELRKDEILRVLQEKLKTLLNERATVIRET